MNKNVNKIENNKKPGIFQNAVNVFNAILSSVEESISSNEMSEVQAMNAFSDKKIKALEKKLSSSETREKMVEDLKVSGTDSITKVTEKVEEDKNKEKEEDGLVK